MPWAGGTYSNPTNISAFDQGGGKIVSSVFASAHDDFEAGINACINASGQNTPSGDLPMGGQRHTNVGAAQSTNQYQRAGDYITQFPVYMIDANSASSESVCVSISAPFWPATASAGMHMWVTPAAVKPLTAPSTVNIQVSSANGNMSQKIVDENGSALMPGAMQTALPAHLVHDGTNFILLNPYAAEFISSTAKFIGGASVSATINANGGLPLNPTFFKDGNIAHMAIRGRIFSVLTSAGGSIPQTSFFMPSVCPVPLRPTGAGRDFPAAAFVSASGGKTRAADIKISTNGNVRFDTVTLTTAVYKTPGITWAITTV